MQLMTPRDKAAVIKEDRAILFEIFSIEINFYCRG
jgi:hypothetical protein